MKKAIQLIAVLLVMATLALPVCADSFTPSVQQKGAPTVAAVEGVKTSDIVVTAVADLDKAAPEVKAAVEEAYKSIETAGSIEKAAPALVETLKVVAPNVKVENLVVRDLVHVDVKADKDQKVVLKFDLQVEKDAVVIPMLFIDGEWVPVDPELVTVNDDGTVSVEFTGEVGILAFVTEKTE